MSKTSINNFAETDFPNAKVKVRQGWLQGYTQQAPNGVLKIFKGIPFAAPPVGELRFRRPRDPGRWRGIRRATQYSAAAVQKVQELGSDKANVHGVPQMLAPSQYEEDCLYLNVWTPAKTQQDKLPVFIWVHGGGMVAGSGVEVVCSGEGLAGRKAIVVVTINYRLGLFGFFAHPQLTAEGEGPSGNWGLHDIRKACQWVRENIAAFGGDPDNITLAGQSGGGRATCASLVSPLMKGLVQHISVESGFMTFGTGAPCPREETEKASQEFMDIVGVKTVGELRRIDAWELFDAFEEYTKDNPFTHKIRFCVDEDFLPENYFEMLTSGKLNDFDVMIGGCAQENPVRGGAGLPLTEFHQHLKRLFPTDYEQMKKWYPAANDVEAEKACTTLASDIMFTNALYVAHTAAQHGNRVFLWTMNKENETPKGHALGCPHCAEMPYVFGRVDTGDRDPFYPYHWVGADYDFMELIQDYWTHFAANGDPNTEDRPQWDPYSKDFTICQLGNHTHMLSEEEQAKYHYLFDKVISEGKDTRTFGLGGAGSTRNWVQPLEKKGEKENG